MANRPIPPIVKEWFEYDPVQGELFWRVDKMSEKRQRVYTKKGSIAGTTTKEGYRVTAIERSNFPTHRIIWFLWYGEDPGEMEVDHINGVRSDNRIENLRLATRKQNSRNLHNTRAISGRKNIFWRKDRSRWVIHIKGETETRRVHCKTLEEAEKIADTMRIELHGEFAPTYS